MIVPVVVVIVVVIVVVVEQSSSSMYFALHSVYKCAFVCSSLCLYVVVVCSSA